MGLLVGCARGQIPSGPAPAPSSGIRCGDGALEGQEPCDRGNLGGKTCQSLGFASGGLQCTADCKLDTAHCTSCPNGVAEPGEECDGDDLAGMASCADLNAGAADEPLLCSEHCVFDLRNCGGCGDGVVTPPEDCEPATELAKADLGGATCEQLGWQGGNLDCDPSCRFNQTGCYACGDATKSGLEQCDGADFGARSCEDFDSITGEPFTSGTLSCTNECKIDLSNCMRCGDGVVTGSEACDPGELRGETCRTLGFSDGTLACAADCRGYDTSGCTRCGDGEVQGNEQCDAPNLGGATCQSMGLGGGTLACSNDCTFNTSGCADQTCGDGIVNGIDACDCGGAGATCTAAQLDNKRCADLPGPGGIPFSGGALRCMSPTYCAYDTSGCHYCGDGAIQDDEQCDGAAFGGRTCLALGYSSGALACTSSCQLDESGCVMTDNPVFSCSSPVAPLPDDAPDGVTDTIQVPSGGQIADVDVVLYVTHAFVGDVRAEVTHGATTRTLIDRPGEPASQYGCARQDIDATLDDEGMAPVEQTCLTTGPAVAGALLPNESLSAFDGQDMSGAWTLRVADVEKDLNGTLVEWCVVISWQ